MKIGIIQFNPTIGDIKGNTDKILENYRQLTNQNPEVIVTPELAITGYPPQDLLHRTKFIDTVENKLETLKQATINNPPLIVGAPVRTNNSQRQPLTNSALIFKNGTKTNQYDKRLLPTYDVFDETRYFHKGVETTITSISGTNIGITICEDAWNDAEITGQQRYTTDPLLETSQQGADIILTLSASPFSVNKPYTREQRFITHSTKTNSPVVFITQIGGNDELIFDGHSIAATDTGITHRFPGFTEYSDVISINTDETKTIPQYNKDTTKQIRDALTLGIQDYFEKTGFNEAIIGLSGGIDSTVTAGLAVDALGSSNVYGVSLPSAVTAQENTTDAEIVATNLGIEFDVIPIHNTVDELTDNLTTHTDTPTNVTHENIQARIRGDILMAIANERDALVLTPDNKSEGSVGYCTLYGDTVGAIAPLGDCYKHVVYDIATSLNKSPPGNTSNPVIPQRVIEKEPTAELRSGQTDTDELPQYNTLDNILNEYIENRTPIDVIKSTYDSETSSTIIQKINQVEFKRSQTPPPLRITQKSLGRGWKYPVAANYDTLQ